MDNQTTDETLMQAYRDGDYAAFEALYGRHKAAVVRFYRRQAGDQVAEELLQEAFLRLIGARLRYQPQALFRTYLWTLVRSVLVDHYRKQSRTLPASYQQTDPDTLDTDGLVESEQLEPSRQACRDQQLNRLLQLIATLPTAQREAFLLKEEAGLSVSEIAAVTGDSFDTIKSRLRYAVKKLRAGLEAL
ncbi:RNA polymerase subunit sigma [Motiliproteus coralliicola]|uniref:RNA polymerase subunit sigma n=1 Tax=Motiliproteus coralliicola TaxID=2283196 RepID=A0A369WU37_9GAMM|nr:sigma-70 family RNA polymerase sigma factor [Motiliproteus coralliicola]RDE24569.1 RNA polymerase subunit sigma [Motiliproteus coralliicola]